ncbi:hypothetical protein MGN70_005900 [Eutypa lata]|nr:hypothetical protein MGN70_005900 [Eutypa lata]
MASIQSLSGFGSSYGLGHHKISKPRTNKVVKPILKKFQSHSEKNSLDLDRGWDEQDEHYMNNGGGGWGGASPTKLTFYDSPGPVRSMKDVNSLSSTSVTPAGCVTGTGMKIGTGVSGGSGSGSGSSSGPSAGRRYHHHHHHHHSRSISGNSHVSIATSNSGNGTPRVGTAFVHPFQQIPGSSTPPLYTNSVASLTVDSRDYSPIITEDDDDDNTIDYEDERRDSLNIQRPLNHHYQHHHHHSPTNYNSPSQSQPALGIRRPSLVSQKTSSSIGEGTAPHPPLRINTSRSFLQSATATPLASVQQQSPAAGVAATAAAAAAATTSLPSPGQAPPPARVAYASKTSRPDLRLDRPTVAESPNSSSHATIVSPSSMIASAPTAAMSPMRSSFESSGFPRLRAKSDLDTATRADHLREARRKFERKERAKEEKYAREEIKRRERADTKRAQEAERQAAAALKEQNAARARQEAAELEDAMLHKRHHRRKISTTSSGRPSLSAARPSMSMSASARPSTSRRNTFGGAGGGGASGGGSGFEKEPEKFSSRNYDSLDAHNPPDFGSEAGHAQGVSFQSTRRTHSAKKKTHSAWHMFLLWLRTKLLRAGKSH